MRPATIAAPTANRSAGRSFPESPLGYRVMMTTVSEIIPGTERSIPPCWITSVCPTATIARIAANGNMPSNELCRTLCGSTIQLTKNSSSVAASAVAALFLTQLDQLLLTSGVSNAAQNLVEAGALVVGLAIYSVP